MSEQERLLRKISSSQFASWELHMFLDTHPGCCDAAKKLDEYREQTKKLIKQYEDNYGPLNVNSSNTSRWEWVTGPWPWENDEEDDN